MKRSLFSVFMFVFLIALPVLAQESVGFNTSKWGGVLAVSQNPANTFSFDLKYDIHLFSVSVTADNNYLSMHQSELSSGADIKDVLKPNQSVKNASALFNVEAIGPSFLMRLSAKDALAFSTKNRVLINVDDIPLDAANMLYDVLLGAGANNYSFSSDYTSINANNWIEYAFTYGRLLINRGSHRLRSGITLKLLQGVGAYALTVRNFQSQLEIANDIVDKVTAEIAYGHTQNLTWGNDNNSWLKNEAMGVGLDIGAVYEYYPSGATGEADINGESTQSSDYKFKIGFAILDLGGITYQKKLGSRNFNADVDVLDIVVFDAIENQADINAVLNNIAGVTPDPSDNGKFTMDLPARINANVDVRIFKGIYFNLNPVIALSGGKGDSYRIHQRTMSYFSLRIEKPWLGIYIPGSIGGLGGFRLGIGLKLGPLLIGSSSLFSTLVSGQTQAADIFIGLRIPLV
ncbi:MAG: hypothetical protein JXI33_01170 [Candidatus Aminicenantes bacterium]|nr:hypothetical protein [Candidatus Aminicenantes bacterium]